MSARLSGKVAIVTGAGTAGDGVGIGYAISVVLAREGASVLLVDKVEERASATLRVIEEEGGTSAVFVGDVSSPDSCEAMVAAAGEHFGGLDILVNNAAISRHVSILETSPELYAEVIGVNLTGSFMACKFAIPALIRVEADRSSTSGRSPGCATRARHTRPIARRRRLNSA